MASYSKFGGLWKMGIVMSDGRYYSATLKLGYFLVFEQVYLLMYGII